MTISILGKRFQSNKNFKREILHKGKNINLPGKLNYPAKNRASKYRKQNLTHLKRENRKTTVTTGNFNTLTLVTDRTTRNIMNKVAEDLNHQNKLGSNCLK